MHILLLRDPFNTFASRRKSPLIGHSHPDYFSGLTLPQLYLQYLRAFSRSDAGFPKSEPTIFVHFNRWVCDRDYRRSLALQLQLNFTDEGFQNVSQFGGGSSFDTTTEAMELRLDDRWRAFEDDIAYVRLFRNPVLTELSKLHFPDAYDQVLPWLEHRVFPVQTAAATLIDDLALRTTAPFIAGVRSNRTIITGLRKLRQFLLR